MSTKKVLHPLIVEQSQGYYGSEKNQTIEEIEKELTIREMIGACKFNIKKYRKRAGKKGSKEADLKKAEHYCDYLTFLGGILELPFVKEVHTVWEILNTNYLLGMITYDINEGKRISTEEYFRLPSKKYYGYVIDGNYGIWENSMKEFLGEA